MDIADILHTVPDYQEFFSPDELHHNSVQLVEEFPDLARLRQIGTSTDGRPIEMLTIGHGSRTALLFGVPHPNEPIGTLSLDFLSRVLCERDDICRQLDTTFLIVKVIDPDGLALNAGWLKGAFSPLRYALNYYRPTQDEQVEWGFPIDYKTLHFSDPSAETRVLMRLMEDYRPSFCYSLHNASFCGVYFYASRRLPALFRQFHRLVAAQGLDLHQGEPEVPYIQPWAQAVYPFFSVRDSYDYMERNLGGDPAEHILTGTSSADYLQERVSDALTLVCELPYFTDPALADSSPSGRSRRDALAEGMRRTQKTVGLIETHFSALKEKVPANRLCRSVADYLGRTPKRLAAQQKQIQDPAYDEEATAAQAFDVLVCRNLHPALYLGQVYRLAKDAGERVRADEIRARLEERIRQIEAESDIVILALKKLVAVQVGSGLLALQTQMDRS
jgi:hypothetical protein